MLFNRVESLFLVYSCWCVVHSSQQTITDGHHDMVSNMSFEISFTLHGLVPAVFTPFNNDYSLNIGIIPKYVRYLKSKGVKGVLVHGTTGEGLSLSTEERMTSAEQWIRFGKAEGLHVMVQVGGGALPHVVQLAQHAEKHGADSILTLPELYFRPKTPTELVDYLEIISKAAPKTPLLYYDFSSMSLVRLDMAQLVHEAQKRVKTFRGIKTSPNFEDTEAIRKVAHNTTTIFFGLKKLMFPAFIMGLDSTIGSMFNMFMDYPTQILQESKKPELLGEALRKQREFSDVVSVITKYGSWYSSMKAAMNIISGLDMGPVRPPNKSLTPHQVQDLAKELQKLLKDRMIPV